MAFYLNNEILIEHLCCHAHANHDHFQSNDLSFRLPVSGSICIFNYTIFKMNHSDVLLFLVFNNFLFNSQKNQRLTERNEEMMMMKDQALGGRKGDLMLVQVHQTWTGKAECQRKKKKELDR